ncbi:MAG: hypothetical protein DIJKHBIC_02571 [Thermoanaerobaculia bacterium]|nr:hypothetical protein [Thermoanaerobaculia bacterium]
MRLTRSTSWILGLGLLVSASSSSLAQDAGQADKATLEKAQPKPLYSPYAGRDYPTRPLFGDTHLHTALSFDAGIFGARVTPEDAYRFARGEEITSSTGQRVKLSRPLDWLVVADHSDNMGLITDLMAGKPELLAVPKGRRWYDMMQEGKGADAAIEMIMSFGEGTFPKEMVYAPGTPAYRSAWQAEIKAAETYNDPKRFTAFIGFEWTSNTGANNLHRNIIFRGNGAQAILVEPFVTFKPWGSDNPEDLWKWMTATEEKTGSPVLAIAHNGNLSNGIMFPMVEAFGKKLDRQYVETRAKRERLYEVTQTKGTGEAHPVLSPNDEFADFEIWDKGNLDGSVAKKKEMLEYEYARSALKNGLKLEQQLGVNPYKFGMIGSTDAHNGLAAVEEDNFFGKTAPQEPSPERLTKTFVTNPKSGVKIMDWEVGASGYAAVWAMENTRESIFDAMQRRETYATTGSRMIVRFFGGFNFEPRDAQDRMPARIGYSKGVPMGGDLEKAPKGKSPAFLVAALKDPIGANLDRIQIIKGWMDAKGELHEKVYDVAWSDGRKPDPKTGKLPSVGNTVDIASATWTNSIGSPELIAVWKDPSFDPTQRAFYYVRVIEIPTPRWTAYDAQRFGIKPHPETRMTVTERAYTSPIWYTPN